MIIYGTALLVGTAMECNAELQFKKNLNKLLGFTLLSPTS